MNMCIRGVIEEGEISLMEKNKILEDKIRAFTIKVNNLKEHNRCNITNEEDACKVKMLKDEITSMRNKVSNEKQKRAKAKQELKALKEEVVALELQGTRN